MSRLALLALMGSALSPLAACGPAAAAPESVSAPILLDRHPELLVELKLPERSREAAPERIPVQGAWRAVATVNGVRSWETTLPVRLRTLFFASPPEDLSVFRAENGQALRHTRSARQSDDIDSWEFGPTTLKVRRAAKEGPPEPGEYEVSYARAVTRENELNRATSGLSPEEFLFRSLQVEDTTRHGLLLPAPASATFEVDVPAEGVLDLRAQLLPPEAADLPPSDGAALRISVQVGDGPEEEIGLTRLDAPGLERVRHSLERWAGQRVRLRFQTEPGEDVTGDYVFLAEPTVYAPQEDPPRVVLVFIDTLRQDHLSVYGYPRETTPKLTRWAEDAAVFEQARSIAPWTLPSARTMVTGVVPERWKEVESLPRRFARAGWATAFIAGNTYLSSNFEIDRDWGVHRCINWPRAEVEIDRGLAFLEENADRPALLLVHLMDQHLPYRESLLWRYRFAGKRPRELDSDHFLRGDIQKLGTRLSEDGRQHLRDRYDNNLAYVDHELARLLGRLDTDTRDTVLILSDHGEEFWDHGGFEHGHTLYDELLRIPTLLAGPGVTPGRYAEPVSMLDMAPTLARAAGLSLEGMTGWPLHELADRSRAADFEARPQAFGRPLYGTQLWGSLAEDRKYTIDEGRERVFDVAKDPLEDEARTPELTEAELMRRAMAEALGTPVVQAWRLRTQDYTSPYVTEAELYVPGGIAHAWASQDPTGGSSASVELDGDTAILRWEANNSRFIEIFVVPAGDPVQSLATATLSIRARDGALLPGTATWSAEEGPPAPNGKGTTLLRATDRGRAVMLNQMTVPLPYAEGSELSGFDAEVAGELKALGYLDH